MTDYNSDDNNVDSSIDQDEFSVADVGGDSSAVLEALRTRLLDLTLLNRVLNFKVNAPRVVRIIDDLPDQIFVRLRQGAELEFLPVPIPPAEHELHKKASGGKRERQSVAETYAKELGFDTSFDLPAPLPGSGAIGEAHADSLQTILLPPDLEVALRAISVEARTAVEEKGSNILYLMFGFLEWYEDSSSERAILSPLVMLPVSLRRGDPTAPPVRTATSYFTPRRTFSQTYRYRRRFVETSVCHCQKYRTMKRHVSTSTELNMTYRSIQDGGFAGKSLLAYSRSRNSSCFVTLTREIGQPERDRPIIR